MSMHCFQATVDKRLSQKDYAHMITIHSGLRAFGIFDLMKIILIELPNERCEIGVFEVFWENCTSELVHVLVCEEILRSVILPIRFDKHRDAL